MTAEPVQITNFSDPKRVGVDLDRTPDLDPATLENPCNNNKERSPMSQRPMHPTPEDPFYQAIGYVRGSFSDEQIHIRQGSYPAIPMLAARRKLEQIQGQTLRFSVYPKFNLKSGELKFLIRGWNPADEQLDEWHLAGLWQFIPQYRRPVLAIHRNEKHWDGDKCKSTYLPFVWKDGPNPWRFNPRAEEKGYPLFICCTATLDRKFPRFFLKDELFQLERAPRRVPKAPAGTIRKPRFDSEDDSLSEEQTLEQTSEQTLEQTSEQTLEQASEQTLGQTSGPGLEASPEEPVPQEAARPKAKPKLKKQVA